MKKELLMIFGKNRVFGIKSTFYILLCGFLWITTSTPSVPFVIMVFDLVKMLGLLAVLLVPTIMLLIRMAASSYTEDPPFNGISHFLRMLGVYFTMLWWIGFGGDACYTWCLENTTEAIAVAVALFLVYVIVQLSGLGTDTKVSSPTTGYYAVSPEIYKKDKQPN